MIEACVGRTAASVSIRNSKRWGVLKIEAIEVLQADAGTRPYSFVKVTTESGLVGWSEFTEATGNAGTRSTIAALSRHLIGQPADRVEWAMAIAYTKTVPVWNGIAAHARAAIANALLDVTAKAAGVPVHAMFGGKVRDRVPVYWTHFLRPAHQQSGNRRAGTRPLLRTDLRTCLPRRKHGAFRQ